MLTSNALVNLAFRPCINSMVHLMLVIVSGVALLGCSGEGGGGPVISSISTQANQPIGPASDLTSRPVDTRPASLSLTDDGMADFSSEFPPGPLYADDPPSRSESSEDDPMTIVTSTPTGVTVRLYWPRSPDGNIFGYSVYYGKEPAQEEGSCSSYEAHQVVEAPPATITGLEPDTLYFFAIKQFNESDKSCVNEIIVPTPPAETEQTERAMESLVHPVEYSQKG